MPRWGRTHAFLLDFEGIRRVNQLATRDIAPRNPIERRPRGMTGPAVKDTGAMPVWTYS